MLYIQTSNQLEQLAALYTTTVSIPLNNVFTKEMVVVQNSGMARWLSMQSADIAGISANVEYLFPAEFMWKLLRIVSPDVSEQSQCTPETLRYHIMQELTEHHADYPELAHYIYHQISEANLDNKTSFNEVSSWELSCQLSDIFDQYLFFRGELIQQWEESPEAYFDTDWQARLWTRCVKNKNLIHWKVLQDQFKESIDSIDKLAFPERVSFFSMPALSPGYIDLLGELAKLTDVYFYIINPCEEAYWGDIVSEKSQAKQTNNDVETYTEVGNPLLASMGKQGRDFIHQLLDVPLSEHFSSTSVRSEEERKSSLNNILPQLQNDIYTLKEPLKITGYHFQGDNSIRFNACHTAMREVEVLYDQILDALDSDDSLAPSDIVVMLPDIESYAPYIEAIFSSSSVKLPYSIADRASINAQQLVEALMKMLKLVDTRFDVESVFEILDYQEISACFNLDEVDVNKCRKLALATNIRWGIDKQYRKDNNLPDTQEHTWKYALDGVLLGYALGESDDGRQLFSISNDTDLPLLSHNIIEGNDAVILANLKQFTNVIFAIADWQKLNCSMDDWLSKIKILINQIFAENSDVTLLLKVLNAIQQTTELTGFEQHISFGVFFKILQSSLADITGGEKFLGYGITFCAMVPMRSIPFKVVALMGMNDGEFPRQNKRQSFDRLAENPRKGDRSRRDEDRYLFLESVLAARSRLIISYIGQSVKDNTDVPPSVLVSELLDALSIYSCLSADAWIVKHPLQAFSSRYFDASSDLFSYAKEYAEFNKLIEEPSQVFISERLEELGDEFKKISLNELIKFYQSPARTFLTQRFSAHSYDEEITLPIREPFELESFKDRDIRNILLRPNNEDHLITAKAKGLLPYGEIGEGVFDTEKKIIDDFQEKLPDILYIENQPFLMDFNDFQLFGELNNLSEAGLVIQHVSKINFRDYIEIWLRHLVLNAVFNNKKEKDTSRYTTLYTPEYSFTLSPVNNANELLTQLLEYYWEGLHFPSKFFPKSALALYKKGEENIKDAIGAWHGSGWVAGEKNKFEHWVLYRSLEMNEKNIPQEFLGISQLIFGELFAHLDEI